MNQPPTEAELVALLRRRTLALEAASHVRGVLHYVEALFAPQDVLAAKAAHRIELAARNLERVSVNAVTELRRARSRFRLPGYIASEIDALDQEER